jgi:hypothetical protein
LREIKTDLPEGILAIGGDNVLIVDSKLERSDLLGFTGSIGQVYAKEENRQDNGRVIGELSIQSVNLYDFLSRTK